MEPRIHSLSSSNNNVRQDVFPMDRWTITTRKGIILQSKCTCDKDAKSSRDVVEAPSELLCNICKYHRLLPQLHNLPDMLFNENILRLEYHSGIGIEFNALDALKLVEATKDPLRVAVADGWQSARADFPFASRVIRPFDWTFTTAYKGTLLTSKPKSRSSTRSDPPTQGLQVRDTQEPAEADRLSLLVEPTDERIDMNKLKVKEEILFYDDVALYEDELADHGTAQCSVKVRVMPKSLFILARYYLRVDGVLARINDTRIYHEFKQKYLLREYTNRECNLNSLSLPVSTLINPNELANHLPIIENSFEKLLIPEHR